MDSVECPPNSVLDRRRWTDAGDRSMTGASAEAANAECERITKEQARNFYWGIRLLPTPKRNALSAVYALARRIDDIGDGDLPAEQKLRLLAQARSGSAAPEEYPDDLVL